MTTTAEVISSQELLEHWQGHRGLTRRLIEAFPEKDFFEFSIGGMRSFAQLVNELLAIGAPGLRAIVNRNSERYTESGTTALITKAQYLEKWDEATTEINENWQKLQPEDFGQVFNLFGQYEFTVIHNIFYFIDNEIHHRGQAYVYLRALGIEPPFFWER
jgi:uncharacterized damage-inducible protein DinB